MDGHPAVEVRESSGAGKRIPPPMNGSAAEHGRRRLRVATVRAALMCVLLPLAGLGCSRPNDDVLTRARTAGTLRVALTQANPPWNFLNGGDHPVGYDADVANELARRLKIGKVDFVGSDFASFVGGIRADRFDIVISGQTITAERRKQVDFSRPYAVNEVSVFVRKDDGAISGVKDLTGKRVAVSEGTTQAEFARTGIPDADVRTYKNATLGLTDLARGRADAALVSRFLGGYLAQQKGLSVKPVGPTLQTEVLGMSFRKGSLPFKQAVDQAIDAMIADGTLSAISRRWLNGIDMAAELREVPPGRYP
ncbi:transporter substrate-binding domain-containing protein [Planotetraspora kaengkrachanensis]|uniref:Uncharacterized protein n=1 Tax=Planotetraspora kaengkrachanensis TaxID=575193 RepID=A0A8J3M1U3_9ACTN|nr:transporter substrate-binding domain-containing protein [Planotetraspora kaengkrachanensis]GIG77799.1 hypothetical protein Pka01_09260 [Planotetraspora kaengkrachanensis]